MNDNKLGTIIITIILVILVIWGIYYVATHGSSQTTINNYTTDQTNNTGDQIENTRISKPSVSTKPAAFISASTATLNGEVNPNRGQTSYWYEYGTTESLGSNTRPQLIGSGSVSYSAPITVSGLKANTGYFYRIVAENQSGQTVGETSSFKTTNSAPLPHILPTVETWPADLIKTNSASLNGKVNPRGSETYYWFEYGTTFGLGNTTAIVSAGRGNTNVTADGASVNLEPDRTYYFRLNAQNAYGTVNGNILVFSTPPTTPPEPAPGKVPDATTTSATNVTTTSATLHGTVNPNSTNTTYYFVYGKSTLFGIFSLESKTDEQSAGNAGTARAVAQSVTNLDSDSTYYYQLVTKNQYGTTYGAIYSFTTRK